MRNNPPIPSTDEAKRTVDFVLAPPVSSSKTQSRSPLSGWPQLAQLPSWLVSFVLHLAVFLFLASIVIPYSRNSRLSILQFAFSKKNPTEVETRLAELAVEAEISPPAEKTEEPPTPVAPAKPTESPVEEPNRIPPEKVAEITESLEKSIDPIRTIVATAKLAFEADQQQQLNDEIVDQFIEYDLGRLTGDAGHQARRRFQQLGPDSIPSLVRGLNKSARYHASCPVGVISRKLKNTLKESGDRQLIDYAINHVGDGVAKGMPHARSVFSVQKWITERFVDTREQLVSELKGKGLPADDESVRRVENALDLNRKELIELIFQLADSSDQDELLAMLAAVNLKRLSTFSAADLGTSLSNVIEGEPTAATKMAGEMLRELAPLANFDIGPDSAAVWKLYWQLRSTSAKSRFLVQHFEQNPNELPIVLQLVCSYPLDLNRRDRHRLGMAATEMIESDDSDAADIAVTALSKIAGGSDFGHDPRSWKTYWNEYKKIQLDEPSAMAKYRQGVMLLKRGKKDAAADYFNQVIEMFPDTSAARMASQGLEKIANKTNAI